MKLDFSQFHPLDHWPGSPYCRSLYGGVRNHLSMTWRYRRREQALWPFHRLLRCPFGRHDWQVWYRHVDAQRRSVRPVCRYCPATRLPSEAELDGRTPFG